MFACRALDRSKAHRLVSRVAYEKEWAPQGREPQRTAPHCLLRTALPSRVGHVGMGWLVRPAVAWQERGRESMNRIKIHFAETPPHPLVSPWSHCTIHSALLYSPSPRQSMHRPTRL